MCPRFYTGAPSRWIPLFSPPGDHNLRVPNLRTHLYHRDPHALNTGNFLRGTAFWTHCLLDAQPSGRGTPLIGPLLLVQTVARLALPIATAIFRRLVLVAGAAIPAVPTIGWPASRHDHQRALR